MTALEEIKKLIETFSESEFENYIKENHELINHLFGFHLEMWYHTNISIDPFYSLGKTSQQRCIKIIERLEKNEPILNHSKPSGWDAKRGWFDYTLDKPHNHYMYCMCCDSCKIKTETFIKNNIRYPQLYNWEELQKFYNKQFQKEKK